MKVTVCPICRVTPDITNTKLTCPKCGRTAVGKDLTETVERWNRGETTPEEVVAQPVPEPPVVEETIEEAPEEVEEAPEEIETVPEKKAEKKPPVKKTIKKTGKKEDK